MSNYQEACLYYTIEITMSMDSVLRYLQQLHCVVKISSCSLDENSGKVNTVVLPTSIIEEYANFKLEFNKIKI